MYHLKTDARINTFRSLRHEHQISDEPPCIRNILGLDLKGFYSEMDGQTERPFFLLTVLVILLVSLCVSLTKYLAKST